MNKNIQYTNKLREQIKTLKKENRYLEFKSNYQEADRLGKYISALSNGACLDKEDYGYLYFGIEDETLNVKGTTFDIFNMKAKGNQSLELYLRQYISPKINFTIEEFLYDEKVRIVMFRIPAAKNEPTCFMNKSYVRVDSHLTELAPYTDWMRMIYTSMTDWTAEIVPDATIDDLDKDAIKIVRNGYNLRFPDYAQEASEWSNQVFLDKANLTRDGAITRAALLLIGKKEKVHKLRHIAEIVLKCYQDGKRFGYIFTIPFVKSTTELLQRIRNYQFKIYPKNSLIPTEVWKYDTRSILEGVHNCIVHQDYTLNERIIVTEDTNKLTFENAGDFFEGSYEQYVLGEKTPNKYRNPFLMRAMVNVKMIDSQGYGIHNMFESQKERFLPMPDYEITDNNVVMHLPGTIIDENYSLLLMERTDITLTETILLDQVQKGIEISKSAVKDLRNKYLIEGRYPNLFVSKSIANIANQKAEYSKHKGINEMACETIILGSLKDHGSLSKNEINQLLWDLLSDLLNENQKRRKIEYILKKMKGKGLINNVTKGKTSTYLLAK